jgi:hypothetical protein
MSAKISLLQHSLIALTANGKALPSTRFVDLSFWGCYPAMFGWTKENEQALAQHHKHLRHCQQPHQVDRLLVSIFIDIALLRVHPMKKIEVGSLSLAAR